MNAPAQQKAPESLARLEGGVPASLTEKDNTIMAQTTDTVTSTADWKHELVYSTPGVFRPADVLNTLRKVHTLDEARAIVEREIPTFPAPENAALPSWAATANPWSWMDGEWQRVVEKADLIRPGRGFTVAVLEYAHAGGTITRTSPILDANLPTAETLSLGDATLLSRLAALSATTLATAMSVWKDELVAGTPGLRDPKTARSRIEGVDDPERVEEFVRQSVAEQQRAFDAMPPLPSWAHGAFGTEQEGPGVFSRTSWTPDRVFEEKGDSIEVGGCLAERTLADGTLVQVASIALGNDVFTTGKAREIAAAIVEFADLVDSNVAAVAA